MRQHFKRNALVTFLIDVRRSRTFIRKLRQFVIIRIKVRYAHQDAQVGIVTHGHRNHRTQFFKALQHRGSHGFHFHDIRVFGSLCQDTVHQQRIVRTIFVGTIDVLVAQFVSYLFQQFLQQDILHIAG